MNTPTDTVVKRADFAEHKAIFCVVPDDGTDKRVMIELREKWGIVSASSRVRRGIGALARAKTKRGKLPEAQMVKELCVICTPEQVDAVFQHIFWSARVDKPGRGFMYQRSLPSCTPYEMPADIPDEEKGP